MTDLNGNGITSVADCDGYSRNIHGNFVFSPLDNASIQF